MNNKRHGYSVLELMLTVAVAGVLAAVGVPTFTNLALDSRRTAVANELLADLVLARGEAIKRGQPLVVCGISDSNRNGSLDPAERHCAGHDWTDGWMVGTWADLNHDGVVGSDELSPLRESLTGAAGRLTVIAGNFSASPPVGPAGTAVIKGFSRRSSNGTITLCDRRGPRQARAVIVSPNGRARVSATRPDGSAPVCP